MRASAARAFALLAAAVLAGPAAAAARAAPKEPVSPCPQIVFISTETVQLTAIETNLICGDPGTEGWKEIPLPQAKYFLQTFLQERGYQNPRFTADNDVLSVDIGTQSRVTSLMVSGFPPGIDASKVRKIKGSVMTPKLLNKARSALFNALQNRGYACPEIKISADSVTGVLAAQASPGAVYAVDRIVPAQLEGVDPAVFNRYEAFEYGKRFDMRLLTLTAQRTVQDSIFLSAYYDVSCSTAGALTITQRVVQGKPQLYRVGVGFDTEGYIMGRAQWRHARVGHRVSSLEGQLFGSFREQTAETGMRWYMRPASRLHLRPRAYFRHRDEIRFESINTGLSVVPATSWDTQGLRLELAAGPALEHVDTQRGLGPSKDTFLAWTTQLDFTEHGFEYYMRDPREGWRHTLQTWSRAAGVYSSLTAHRLLAQGELLWNLGNYDPPLLVLGTRYWAGTVYVPDPATALRELPLDMRFFLGGDANVRGLARKEVPGDDVGFLTAIYDGIELRLGDVLPGGLQPLAFIDAAMAGRTHFHLDRDVYWSPGAGVRWRLPFGAIRATLARGFVWRRESVVPALHKPHWQFFFSLGREF